MGVLSERAPLGKFPCRCIRWCAQARSTMFQEVQVPLAEDSVLVLETIYIFSTDN